MSQNDLSFDLCTFGPSHAAPYHFNLYSKTAQMKMELLPLKSTFVLLLYFPQGRLQEAKIIQGAEFPAQNQISGE